MHFSISLKSYIKIKTFSYSLIFLNILYKRFRIGTIECIWKNLWRRTCVRKAIFRNVEVRVRPIQPLLFLPPGFNRCATCKGSSFTKNEYNISYQKLDAEYFLIQHFFRKKQYFPRKPWKTVLGAYLTIF